MIGGARISPNTRVRMLQVLPRLPQDGTPERRFGRTGTLDKIKHEAVSGPLTGSSEA